MRIRADDLQKFDRPVPPAPPPIEPVLAAEEEARLLSSKRSSDPVIEARRARVLELPRRPAVPEGADAELVALLAPAGTLPIQRDADRLLARLRLTEIGRLTDPPPHVRDLMTQRKLTPGDGPAFANALIPGTRDPSHFHESGAGMFGSS